MSVFAKLKNLVSATATRAMNKSAMIATCHALGWAIYADGVVEDAELESAMRTARNSPRLNAFGGEFNRTLDGVLQGFKDSSRMAKVAAKRHISEFAANATGEEREDVLIQTLDMLESDGNFGDDEKKMVEELAGILGLNYQNYM